MDTLHKIRTEVNSAFKLSGFTIRKDASIFVAEQLSSQSYEERQAMLDKLTSHLLRQCLSQPILEKCHLATAYVECSTSGLEEAETVLNIIDAFSVPKLSYVSERKKFIKVNNSISLYSDPKWKAQFMIDRYTVIWQRTVRNKLFVAKTATADSDKKNFQLQKVEFLLSSSSRKDDILVLGLLTQLTERRYYLEDPTGAVPLDMSHTKFHSGLFTESSYVLAEGYYDDKVFHVISLMQPPIESRSHSLPYFGNLNTFGGKSKTSLKNSKALLQIEKEDDNGIFVFLSDVWLDSVKVMNKLRTLFSGFNDYPPIAMIFMGEFLSCPYGSEHSAQLRGALNTLGDLIMQFSNLKMQCKFILVPSKGDPAAPNVLPRPAISNYVISDIESKLGDSIIFTTNPCRIQYCTQEFVVFRQDLVTKLCRNVIHFPEVGDIPDHLTKTLLSQCTLSPMSSGIQPVYWKHTDALNLYPIPDLIIVADQFQPYTRSIEGCHIVNPGSFPRTEFSFKVYVPASRTVEDSQIPKDDEGV